MSLLVIGALHWDVVVRAPRLPRLDETLRGQDVAYQFGGKGGNQAIAAAKAGIDVAFAGRVGSDDAGAAMIETLASAGVNVSQVQKGDGASGMSAAIVTENGEYGAVIVSAENHAFDVSKMAFPKECTTVLLQNEMAEGTLADCAAAARAHGLRVVLNAAPAPGIDQGDLEFVDTLIVNRIEAEDLLGQPLGDGPLGAIAALASLAPQAEIILTLGKDGAVFTAPGIPAQWQKAEPVTVRSTHGAGDVFVGTFAAHRLRGASLDSAVGAGQKAAAAHIS